MPDMAEAPPLIPTLPNHHMGQMTQNPPRAI